MWWEEKDNLSPNQVLKWDYASVALALVCTATFVYVMIKVIAYDMHPVFLVPSIFGIFLGVLNIKKIEAVHIKVDNK